MTSCNHKRDIHFDESINNKKKRTKTLCPQYILNVSLCFLLIIKQQRAIRTINKILKQKKNKPISIQAQKLNNNKNNINKLLKNTTPPPRKKTQTNYHKSIKLNNNKYRISHRSW